jgi:hypothetical protein
MMMKMIRLNVQIPATLKTKLDDLRRQGTTASGFIRNLLERELRGSKPTKRG